MLVYNKIRLAFWEKHPGTGRYNAVNTPPVLDENQAVRIKIKGESLKQIVAALLVGLCVAVLAPFASAQEIAAVTSEAYLVMDADTGQVILEKNPDKQMYPASITKIMTIALAIQQAGGDWAQQRVISKEVTTNLEPGSSHVALLEGEQVKLEDLIYATQLESANDGANALAEFFSPDGTIAGGVERMNQTAQQLGLTSTQYRNPHGLHDPEHYTTARDMAHLLRWALEIPGFSDVFCRKDSWPMEATNLQPERRFWCADLMRVGGPTYYREYVLGSKTGFHNQAGHTLVTYAQQGDMRLICVVLKSAGSRVHFKDAALLLDYAFEHFRRVELTAPAQLASVPLLGGDTQLGTLTVHPASATALLHEQFTPEQVTAEYRLPEYYILGQAFDGVLEYRLPDNEVQPSLVASPSVSVTGLSELLEQNTFVPQKEDGHLLQGVGITLGIILVIVGTGAAIRLIRKSGKEQAKERKTILEDEIAGNPFIVNAISPRWQQRTPKKPKPIQRNRPGGSKVRRR